VDKSVDRYEGLVRVRVALLGSPDQPISVAARAFLSGKVDVVLDSDERVSVSQLHDARPDVILSAAHHFTIGPRQRATARLGAVGLHPSLLPRYRGSWPLWWALRNREREVGLSLYHLADEMDAGNVIAQRSVRVEGDTFASLYEKVALEVAPLLGELLKAIEAGGIPEGAPQDASQATRYDTPGLMPRVWMKLSRFR
jgi:methionyl-tRNA formyltransferase